MGAPRRDGLLGIFREVDATSEAIEDLRKAGFKDLVVFSPLPRHELEDALASPESPVRIFTLVGGLTGAATGFALPIATVIDWPLVTGGMPMIPIPPYVIIAFELTILFGALATVLGMLITMRLPRLRLRVVYDPSFSADGFGVLVVPPDGREAEARDILNSAGATEIRDNPEETPVGTV